MKTAHEVPKAGAFFEGRYPFTRETYEKTDYDGDDWHTVKVPSWKPGTRYELRGGYGPNCEPDSVCVADGVGTISLTVVGAFKPGKFPTRVFFTRRWRDPDGRWFGKGALRITTVSNFYALTRGYRHEYEMTEKPSALLATKADLAIGIPGQ